MRNLDLLTCRQPASEKSFYGRRGDSGNGVFMLKSPIDGGLLMIVASNGDGWDHVSVSRSNRCPNWPEMDFIKQTFFKNDECVMQLHVPLSDHLNVHPHCLHLWRPQNIAIPRPPNSMVAPEKASA